MTDQQRVRRRIKVRPEQEGLVRLMRAIAREEADRLLPSMGTVLDEDAGAVRVRLDEEDDDRTVPFPRRLGSRYRRGSRVRVVRTATGEEVVDGVISEAKGAGERVVGEPDLEDAAVGRRALVKKAVGREEIDDAAVGTAQIQDGTVTKKKIPAGTVDNELLADGIEGAKLKDRSVLPAKLDTDTQNRIAGAAQSADLQDAIKKEKPALATQDFAKGEVKPVADKVNGHDKDLRRLKQDIGNLKGDIQKVEGSIPDKVDTSKFVTQEDLTQLRRDLEAFVNDKVKSSRKGESA